MLLIEQCSNKSSSSWHNHLSVRIIQKMLCWFKHGGLFAARSVASQLLVVKRASLFARGLVVRAGLAVRAQLARVGSDASITALIILQQRLFHASLLHSGRLFLPSFSQLKVDRLHHRQSSIKLRIEAMQVDHLIALFYLFSSLILYADKGNEPYARLVSRTKRRPRRKPDAR